MSGPVVRLVMKVPRSVQIGPDSWANTTRYETFDLPCPAKLLGRFTGNAEWAPVIVGAEVRTDSDPPDGGGS